MLSQTTADHDIKEFMHESGFMLIRQTAFLEKPNTETGALAGDHSRQTTVGCREQPADSQIRSDREKPCSHRTPGPPHGALLSSQSPSSPRRRSSEGRRRKKRGRGGWKRKVKPALQSSNTNRQSSCSKREKVLLLYNKYSFSESNYSLFSWT